MAKRIFKNRAIYLMEGLVTPSMKAYSGLTSVVFVGKENEVVGIAADEGKISWMRDGHYFLDQDLRNFWPKTNIIKRKEIILDTKSYQYGFYQNKYEYAALFKGEKLMPVVKNSLDFFKIQVINNAFRTFKVNQKRINAFFDFLYLTEKNNNPTWDLKLFFPGDLRYAKKALKAIAELKNRGMSKRAILLLLTKFKKLALCIANMKDSYNDLAFDFHNGNWMKRKRGGLVLNDPFVKY